MATRRANGEATYKTRKDGRIEGQIRYTDARGNSQRVSAYGKTRKLAKVAVEEKLARIRDGLAVVDSKSPLADIARKWRTSTLVASRRGQSTKDLYATRCRLYIEEGLLAQIPLARLTPSDIENWIVAARENKVAPSSLRTDYVVLRAILDTAVRDGVVAKNVAAQVDRPVVPRKEALHLTPAQVSELLEAVSHSRHYLPILIAATTGMRRGEVMALRWRDVDLVGGTVTVAGTLSGSGKKLHRVTEAKTSTSRRALPLGADLTELLQERQNVQIAERRRAQGAWQGGDGGETLVFTTELGTMIDPRNVLRTLQTAATKLGLPKGTGIHTLRHSAATAMLTGGAHLKMVATILGHSDTHITADIYGHASDSAQKATLDALHAQMRGPRHLRVVTPTAPPEVADSNEGAG